MLKPKAKQKGKQSVRSGHAKGFQGLKRNEAYKLTDYNSQGILPSVEVSKTSI